MNKSLKEKFFYKTSWTIRRFGSQAEYENGVVSGISKIEGNLLLNEGINELWTILCSTASGTKFNNANSNLGVGDSMVAPDPAQTGLQGVNKTYKGMDVGYPTFGTDQKATWRATYGGLEANHGWKEFSISNGLDDSGINLNRMVSDQSVKVTGQVWELTLEITLG